MKQQPSRLKYRKNHKVSDSFLLLKDHKNFLPLKGRFALKALQAGKLKFKQIEAGRKSIRRNINKKGNLFIKPFTSKSVTKKPIAVRMGKGKGNHSY
jgi:large subunit ribosomal protein L16